MSQPALFSELDQDRHDAASAERDAWTGQHEGLSLCVATNPDDELDIGPDHGLQPRLPAAGWVRLVENPTPTLGLPAQSVRWIICERCGNDTDTWTNQASAWRHTTIRVCPRCARKRNGKR